jgi:hypothetical protein
MARILLTLVMLAALPATAADIDAGRISFLEQEVRNLQRQVQALSNQMDALRAQPGRLAPQTSVPARAQPTAADPKWVDAGKWRALRPGMSELDVIAALGPPTSMREGNGARVLLYALEIGASGFLGGSVTLRERAVTEVRQPSLQ